MRKILENYLFHAPGRCVFIYDFMDGRLLLTRYYENLLNLFDLLNFGEKRPVIDYELDVNFDVFVACRLFRLLTLPLDVLLVDNRVPLNLNTFEEAGKDDGVDLYSALVCVYHTVIPPLVLRVRSHLHSPQSL